MSYEIQQTFDKKKFKIYNNFDPSNRSIEMP